MNTAGPRPPHAKRSAVKVMFRAALGSLGVGVLFVGLGVCFTPDTGQGWAMLSAPFMLLGLILLLVSGPVLLYRKFQATHRE